MKHYRQGHILLDKRRSLPRGATPVEHEPGKVVLARGETGREHLFQSDRVALFRAENDGTTDTFIEVIGEEPVALIHEEHGAIDVDPGVYAIVEQREVETRGIVRRSYPD